MGSFAGFLQVMQETGELSGAGMAFSKVGKWLQVVVGMELNGQV